MKQAIGALTESAGKPDFILVDGKQQLPLQTPQEALVKGDARSASIGAASIIAKILRDEIMTELHHRHPAYNFIGNKGYPTAEHRRIIEAIGPSPAHRFSFKGVREFVKNTDRSR
jgi:ribonuclease HII